MTAMLPSASAPPFFIVGNDRSGTTMLRLVLDRAAEPAIPTESMLLGDFAPVRRRGGLDRHARAVAFARTVWTHPKVRLWGIDGEPPLPPEGLSHEAAYRFCVEAPYLEYMRRHGKSRWGDKTPSYLEHLRELKAVFPEAKFVELVRDGRDVALSIMPLPFGANNAWVAGRDWARGIRLGLEAHAMWPADIHTVRYEQLVADPEAQVRAVCEFLGLAFTPEMLDIEQADRSKVAPGQEAWFRGLWSGINSSSVGKWRRQMSQREQATFQAAAGPELAVHGYEPATGEQPARVRAVRAAAFEAANFATRLVNLVKLRIFQERGRELRYVVRRRLQRS